MPDHQGLRNIEHCRSVLLRTIAEMPREQLNFQLYADSKTIGEILLHVAAFEYLMICCAQVAAAQAIDPEPWEQLMPGFAREVGFAPPIAQPLDFHINMLTAIRRSTVGFFRENEANRFVDKETFAIHEVAQRLGARYPQDDRDCYVRLGRGVGTSFRDDGAVNAENRVDLTDLLQLHETYHRGQITFQRYSISRASQRVS
jgi:hypothetical protein